MTGIFKNLPMSSPFFIHGQNMIFALSLEGQGAQLLLQTSLPPAWAGVCL